MTRAALRSAHPGHLPRPTRAKRAWYGTDLNFQGALLLDIDAHDEHAGLITETLTGPSRHRGRDRVWTFHHAGLDVPGRVDPVPVRIEFHEDPRYPTFELDPWDFPAVFADPGAESKHRHQNIDALCLWFPGDPVERRWHYSDGLVALLNLTRNHLLFEVHWRATGGHGGPGRSEGTWLGDEAAHDYLTALQEAS